VTDYQTAASLLNKENKAYTNSAAFRKVQKLPLQERLDEPTTLMVVAPRVQKTSVISPPTKEHEDVRQPSDKTIEDLYAYDDGNVSLSEEDEDEEDKGVAVQRGRDDNGKEFYDMLADVINRSKQVINMGSTIIIIILLFFLLSSFFLFLSHHCEWFDFLFVFVLVCAIFSVSCCGITR
jgi:uncharacterized membrane protein